MTDACVAGREFHDAWIEDLCALIPEGDESRFSNPEGACEAIILDCFRAYVEQRDAAEARAETLARQIAAVQDVLRDPATSWWHAGGTPCVPAHAIRAALDTATEEATHE